MSKRSGKLHLNAFLMSVGHHEAAWRLPDSDPHGNSSIEHFKQLARTAERGKLDSLFLADSPVLWNDGIAQRPSGTLEPTLLLAALGLYGVTAYAVSRQRTEIGVRLALGAPAGAVVRLVLSRVTLLVGLGVAAGAGVSIWISRFVATLLYGIEPRDPVTLAAAAAILVFVGAMAGWLPAYRASRIDPAETLRDV